MPTIRDVVQALARRQGVDAVVIAGQDGLTIDAHARDGLDVDGLAALVPAVAESCRELGNAASRGGFGTGVVEYQGGLVLIAELNDEALLAMFFRPNTNIGPLLYELRRHRAAIARLL
jgi:predicted regulator of Ras-like GTPase activity (Roadblock/LC7/MglB family)